MSNYYIDKQKVHEIMKKNNIKTQLELASKMGITKNQLSVMLAPNNNPFKKNFQTLYNVLRVEPIEILSINEQVTDNLTSKQSSFESCLDSSGAQLILNALEDSGDFVDITAIKPLRQYNVVELFAGAGGLALGLHKAGFATAGLVEIDKYAAETLRLNRPNWNVIQEDVVKVAENGIRSYLPNPNMEIDLLSGGYPCQAFSYAGHKRGLEDVRGTMFFYYAQILDQLKPKMFLAENVRGLLTHDNGKTLKTMIEVFKNIGYQIQYRVLKAVDYNVAQKRERLVIIGIRNDINHQYRWPKPFDYKPVLKDALKDVPSSPGDKYPEKKLKVLELVPPGGYWRDLPDEIAKEYMGKSYYSGGGRTGMARRISWDEPCLTLTCSPAQKQTERCHPDETRPFTVREYARIQSFPDEWQFFGSTSQQYKQIGNAVPVELAKAVGLSIIDVLNQL